MPEPDVFIIKQNEPLPKISGRGRPRGSGWNLRTLAKMGPGYTLWDIPLKKKNSIKTSAYRNGIKIKVRRMPDSENYVIEKV